MGEYCTFTGEYSGNPSATFEGAGGQVSTANQSTEFHAATGFDVAGDPLASARNQTGSPVVGRELRGSDVVRFDGFDMSVALAVSEGYVTKDVAGNYALTPKGGAGAALAGAPKGGMELASGGTAEEALASDFRASDDTEETLTSITSATAPDTQVAAIDATLRTGEVDAKIVDRMASQAGVEPHEMAEKLEAVRDGMEDAVYRDLEEHGVYDREAFSNWVQSSPQRFARMVESSRDLMRVNSMHGFRALAEEFREAADIEDPATVVEALEDAGIPVTRMRNGGLLLDLTAQGNGQVTFRQAVQLGFIKLSKNR